MVPICWALGQRHVIARHIGVGWPVYGNVVIAVEDVAELNVGEGEIVSGEKGICRKLGIGNGQHIGKFGEGLGDGNGVLP